LNRTGSAGVGRGGFAVISRVENLIEFGGDIGDLRDGIEEDFGWEPSREVTGVLTLVTGVFGKRLAAAAAMLLTAGSIASVI
jgi:hypothetical protein